MPEPIGRGSSEAQGHAQEPRTGHEMTEQRQEQTAEATHVARWLDVWGNAYTWPQACADNRRSRVLARMDRFGMLDDADLSTLTVTRIAGGAK